MNQLKFQGAFGIPGNDDIFVVSLTDLKEERGLTVFADSYTASCFKALETGDKILEQRLPYVLAKMFQNEGIIQEYRVRIYSLKDSICKAELMNMITGEILPMEAGEAVLLAVLGKLEMFADSDTMRNCSTPYHKGCMKMALPIVALPDNMLRQALESAVLQEQYESASVIRDEMKRRNLKE